LSVVVAAAAAAAAAVVSFQSVEPRLGRVSI